MSFEPAIATLERALELASAPARELGLSTADAWAAVVVAALRDVLRAAARERGLSSALLDDGRLFRGVPGFAADELDADRGRLISKLKISLSPPPPARSFGELSAEVFGQLYEAFLALRTKARTSARKLTGSYYTPTALTEVIVGRALAALAASRLDQPAQAQVPLRIIDPAVGAGAFLVRAGRERAAMSGLSLSRIVERELFGIDESPLAVAVAEASLWLLASDATLSLGAAGAHLRAANALVSRARGTVLGRPGIDARREWSKEAQDFDLVIGNPPWVAFAGRAAQPLDPALREYFRQSYRAFSGYPSLHGLFVELAAALAPHGVIALLVPSPLADLAGYRHVRAALARSHVPSEPLPEFGQDAFAGVTQPCFALVARPRERADELDPALAERPWVLSERQRMHGAAEALAPPAALARLAELPHLPAALFGERGLQTNARVSRELLVRGPVPSPEADYPLLEGRDVSEFREGPARRFLRLDREVLQAARCRVRDRAEYGDVKLVVRQTAAITIAALHGGLPFRNSLIAGFELPDFPAALLVGLLNSSLYRALHLATTRDARQAAFPQVKVAHLRALPAPPRRSFACEAIVRIALEASAGGLTLELRRELDRAVGDEFGLSAEEQATVRAFVSARAPNAGLAVPLG